ncbi:MAG: HAD family hydrolase [Candidatus Acidiferrales bacterium]
MIGGAIFDMDGVLVDSHPVHMRAWERFLRSQGRPVSQQDLDFILEGRKREEILRHFMGELTPELLASYGQQKETLFREESTNMKTIPGVTGFLDELRSASLPMAVASCGGRGRVNHLLEQLQLTQYFRFIITGDDVQDGKPDPAIFLKTARHLQIPPEDLLVFEDSVSGVRAACAAGMECLGIADESRTEELTKAGAKCVVRDFFHVNLGKITDLFS